MIKILMFNVLFAGIGIISWAYVGELDLPNLGSFTRPETVTVSEEGVVSEPALLTPPKSINIPVMSKPEIVKIIHTASKGKANPLIILAIAEQESGKDLNQFAVSSAGAKGVMQIMGEWEEKCGLTHSAELFDPHKNIPCGIMVFQDALATADRVKGKNRDFTLRLKDAFKFYNASPKAALKSEAARKYSNEVMARVDTKLRRSLWVEAKEIK